MSYQHFSKNKVHSLVIQRNLNGNRLLKSKKYRIIFFLNTNFFHYQNEELLKLNADLQYKMFLEGEGFEKGKADDEVFLKIKDIHVDKVRYPNVFRWLTFMQKQ